MISTDRKDCPGARSRSAFGPLSRLALNSSPLHERVRQPMGDPFQQTFTC